MSGTKKLHHSGQHKTIARHLCAIWTADPTTRCLGGCTCHALTLDDCTCGQACGLHLDEHPPTAKLPAKWTGGHAWDSVPGSPLRPEVLGCGSSAGATYGNNLRRPEPRVTNWWGTQ